MFWLAAAILTQIAPWAASIAALVGLFGLIYRSRGYIKNSEIQGQIDAKDAIIHTNEQTIESFRARVIGLESDLSRVAVTAKDAEDVVARLQTQLQALERYAAPEAVVRFEEMLSVISQGIQDIQRRLDRVERVVANLTAS